LMCETRKASGCTRPQSAICLHVQEPWATLPRARPYSSTDTRSQQSCNTCHYNRPPIRSFSAAPTAPAPAHSLPTAHPSLAPTFVHVGAICHTTTTVIPDPRSESSSSFHRRAHRSSQSTELHWELCTSRLRPHSNFDSVSLSSESLPKHQVKSVTSQ